MPPSIRSRRLRLPALIAVPLLAAAAWLAIQPADHVASRRAEVVATALVYDEYDFAAMALRGLNAERGRLAGRADWPPYEFRFRDEPPHDRYFLEYPHAALLLFRAGYRVQPGARDVPVPDAVADGDYHAVAQHEPQTPDEVRLWTAFATASRFYMLVMLAAWFLLAAVLAWGYGPGLRGGLALLLLPAAVFFTLNRYDVLPALLTAVSLALLGRRRHTGSAVALAAAVLLKVYPVLLAPLVLRYLWADRRSAVRWAAAFTATGLLAFTPLLFGADLTAVLAPYKFQLTRPPEIGLTIYGCLLPPQLAYGPAGGLFRLGVLGGTLLALAWRPIPDLAGVLRRGAVVLLVFVTLATFYSPQWVVWLLPLLAPLAVRDRRLTVSWVALDLVTYLTFPIWWSMLPTLGDTLLRHWLPTDTAVAVNTHLFHAIGATLRFARLAICGIIAWQLVRAEWPHLLRGTWLNRRLAAEVSVVSSQ